MKLKLLVIGLISANTLFAQTTPSDGKDLIRMMHKQYLNKWYPSLCFAQNVYNYKNDSLVSTDVWYETYRTPGKLILKFSSWESGNGMIFRNDSLYIFSKGYISNKMLRLHDLIILGFDVYQQKIETTIDQAERMGYNLNLIEKVDLNGNPAWLVGDSSKLCFWVNASNLLFLKMKRVTANAYREVDFAKYEIFDGFPVATLIKFYNAPGKLNMVEEYFNVRVNCNVDDSVFMPQKFNKSAW
ncbi:MAG: hypothetical protein AB7S48_13995 [Bacteroidales bacterium]